MRFRSTGILPPLLATMVAAVACSSSSSNPTAPVDSGGSDSTGGDAGPFVFQPKGCGYRVEAVDGFPDLEASADDASTSAPRHVRIGLGGGVDVTQPGYADPSTSFAVGWQTDASNKANHLRYGDAPDKLTNVVDGASYLVPQELSVGPADGTRFHEAHACGLAPGRTYYYQVGGGAAGKELWSATQSVTTAPAKGSKDALTLAFVGDTRDDIKPTVNMPVWRAIAGRIKAGGARAAIFSGDTVLVGADQSMWDRWTDASDATAGALFIAMSPGNHENELTRYFAHVVMPGAGKNSERYFSMDYGSVHLVSIDDYDGVVSPSLDVTNYRDELLPWLEADLAKADGNRAAVPWLVVFHHHPVYDSGADSARVKERKATHDAFVSLFDKHHVDLDVAGHDHFYERSKVLAGDAVATKGTTYVICAAGGAPSYSTTDGNPLSEKIVHYDPTAPEGIYGLMTADATGLDVKVYKLKGTSGTSPADDTVVDQFKLVH